MTDYKTPLRDVQFIMEEVAKLSSGVLVPLNQ